MSNILFALYHDFSANSAVHVHNFANQLAALGHSTAVAIPEDKDTGSTLGTQNYSVHRFDQMDGDWSRVFPDGRPPEIVHAWTPRENVRLFCENSPFFAISLSLCLEITEVISSESGMRSKASSLADGTPNTFRIRELPCFLASARRNHDHGPLERFGRRGSPS